VSSNKTANIPRSSFNFGVIQGGASINSIPSEARAKVDLRSESPERLEEMVALLGSSVERAVELENTRNDGRSDGRTSGRDGGRAGRTAGPSVRTRDRASERDRIAPRRRIAGRRAAARMHSRRGCPSGNPQSPGLLLDPMPTSRCRWASRPYPSAPAGQGGGAHTPAEWFQPERRELGLQRVLLALCMLLGGGVTIKDRRDPDGVVSYDFCLVHKSLLVTLRMAAGFRRSRPERARIARELTNIGETTQGAVASYRCIE